MVVRILSALGSRWKFNVNWAQILPWCLMNVRRIRVKRITLAKLCGALDWAAICRETPRAKGQIAFGIVQGGVFADLRESCAKALVEMDFEGYAIGGVSVGEPEDLILRGVDDTAIHLPEQKPRYLMGVGEMAQMVESVARGVDMFDCVMPTRQARNGTVSTRRGRYPVKAQFIVMMSGHWKKGALVMRVKSLRSYIRHLLNVGEILGLRLITLHNLHCYLEMM